MHRRTLSVADDGPAMELVFQETGSSPVVIYGTAFGDIVGWDIRMPDGKDAFRLSNGLSDGKKNTLLIICFKRAK